MLTPTVLLFTKLPLPPEIVGRVVDNIVGQLKSFSENGNTVLFGADVTNLARVAYTIRAGKVIYQKP